MKPIIKITVIVLLTLLILACKDEMIQSGVEVTASTDRTTYNPGQLITITVNNYTNKTVYINQCGANLYSTIIKIDSSSSGGTSFTPVCRHLTSYELSAGQSVSDTLSFLLPGKYKLKYLYDFENIMPELCREKLYTNEFNIQQ
jgi:hypothetical protein